MITKMSDIIGAFEKGITPNGYTVEATKNLKSSYSTNNYGAFFYALGKMNFFDFYEIGVLEGFAIANYALGSDVSSAKIIGVDLFEGYEYNSYSKCHVMEQLNKLGLGKKVRLVQEDGLTYLNSNLKDIDFSKSMLHLDVSNHGELIESFTSVISYFNFIVFEGGSKERDLVPWMNKYQKKSLRKSLYNFAEENSYNLIQLPLFPSITVCIKC